MYNIKVIETSKNGLYRVIYSEYKNNYKVQQKAGIWIPASKEYKTERGAINYFNKITK